jgi:hypothetical protein
MRYVLIVLLALVCSVGSVGSVAAQVSVGIGLPSVNIGINLPVLPQLVPVPGYPVYYAPAVAANYFFYDGMYWVYQADRWYASSWYNGPWGLVDPLAVPVYLLRTPVRFYRQPPASWQSWRRDAPPHWGERWGHEWAQRRNGWNRADHQPAPAAAPLPRYQASYSRGRYPGPEQQQAIQRREYRYQPREPVIQQHYQRQQERGRGRGHDG